MDCNSGDTFVHEGTNFVRCESIFVPEPVMSLALECKNNVCIFWIEIDIKKNDFMKISKALNRFMKEDPTFISHTDPETKEVL